ncbi:MAG: DNA primase [Deltaproteobacteria bacterium RIFCSPLOWO2_12_FULL_60_16]|nr:MAG: DNA primase [Deltaproteobacteria bacterium RIFCSPLOWO2_12_FULL_60_16]
MIAEGKIVEVRERASIVEVISDHLTLKKMGRNYLGLCPFHAEKTPSFTVNEEKGIFHCFGCGVGGNVFHFLMQYEHLTFPEAVERVGKRYGIPLERLDRPAARKESEEKEALYHINERAAAYFHEMLFGRPEGKRPLEYLKARGVQEELARRFYLGYATQGGQGLVAFLKKEGLPLNHAIRLGLIGERGPQRYGEKFFERVIFPIANAAGKIVGFGGRVINQGLPKYLNSAETPLFRKGATLYGLFQAKEAIREQDRVVVVEGYLDVLALHQFGVSYAVATLGTALTPDHVRILARYTKNIIALFDGDEAGRKAAARSFEVFIDGGLLGRAAFLPGGEDPDSYIRSRGREPLESVLEEAIPLADYTFTWLEEQHGKSIEGKSRTAQEIRRLLAKVRNPFEVDLLVRRAVDSLGVREELLRAPAAGGPARPASAASSRPASVQAREDSVERSLVGLMFRVPSVIEQVEREADLERLVSPKWNEVIQKIFLERRQRGQANPAEIAQGFPVAQASEIAALLLEGEGIPDEECENAAADCLAHLRRRYLRGLERDLRQAIRIAEEKKDEKTKKERMLEWQEVVQKERQLERRRPVPKTEIG